MGETRKERDMYIELLQGHSKESLHLQDPDA